MKTPPTPLTDSCIADDCEEVVGLTLTLRCLYGWGWMQQSGRQQASIDDESIVSAEMSVVIDGYVRFTMPRSGIHGHVPNPPNGYSFTRFLVFIMSEGTDYNFTTNVAPAWRVILGDGCPDYESSWFPVMDDPNALYGYGTIDMPLSA